MASPSPTKPLRLNQYLALALGISRRAADELIKTSKITVNGQPVGLSTKVTGEDQVAVNGNNVHAANFEYVVLNKPSGYVSSRKKQGKSPTIYELLPKKLHHLKPVGRLDKESQGLLLLTNDGGLAQRLTHPSHAKTKVYHVKLNRMLSGEDMNKVNHGIRLKDGISRMQVRQTPGHLEIIMREGKNRQIRRTFTVLKYEVTKLERVKFGDYELGDLKQGEWGQIGAPQSF